ncbi:Rab5-interacting protein-domain-containing protein [Podospora conica]|nr:Rab5-interacting protein-domain-containing protein [Schizothecium conicum]
MSTEKEYQISPLVPESIQHNSKTLYNLQSLTASLFGVAAGILGLESYSGFLFYLAFTLLTAVLFYALRVAPSSSGSASPSGKAGSGGMFDTSRYFRTSMEFWTGGVLGGLAGYILTWTLFFGIVRA